MLSRRISLRNCLRNRYFSQEVAAVSSLVDAYRRYGHLQADLDPLGRKPIIPVLELQPEFHRLELEETVRSEAIARCNLTAFPADSTVSNLLEFLRHRYCKTIGAEFMHIQDMAERQWLMEALERTPQPLTPSAQLNMLSLMVQSEILDEFMQKKFVSYKRYGLDGSEVFLVAIQTILANAASSAIKNVVIGMPHRGRSNVLLTILDYPPRSYFSKVKGMSHTLIAGQLGSDDVVSHLATSVNKRYDSGSVNVSVLHNPSHLEAVNPVALGKVRAIQDMDNDAAADRSMSVQFHGDAAFAGQGIVTESLQLSQLDSFYTGGTVHVILNNQIGFTTDPYRSRSGTYSSDVALMLQCPILHVNGDDPEATHRACALAVEYRQRFKKDAIVDLIAYRKFGHNEVDEPAFTQPTMYEVIRKRKSCAEKYALLLQSKGVRSRHVREKLNKKLNAFLEAELNESEKFVPDPKWNFNGRWTSMAQAQDMIGVIDTGVDANLLKKIGLISVTVPDDVKVHPRLVKSHIAARRQMVADGDALDWATAEAMAIGSLLHDGYNVRLAGQDVQRGTFSQRHATLTDQTNDKQYTPLCSPELGDAKFYPVNSPLSEAGVLGFEFGYSWHSPQNLNIWEAQFGDFWNPAQVIVDNFIATGEAKWIRQSGIVLLLPHGYDGAGPEHSSAKVERILQLCDSNEFAMHDSLVNMSIVNCTTPANYFHALRRQMLRPFRKPLVVIAPKTLLRMPEAVSSLQDMAPGTHFVPVFSNHTAPDQVKHVAFCSGKIYYDLVKQRRETAEPNSYAIIRIEELCPFPFSIIASELSQYSAIRSISWVQEEPANAGAWSFVSPRLRNVAQSALGVGTIEYIGRPTSASPAVGAPNVHREEARSVINEFFANNK